MHKVALTPWDAVLNVGNTWSITRAVTQAMFSNILQVDLQVTELLVAGCRLNPYFPQAQAQVLVIEGVAIGRDGSRHPVVVHTQASVEDALQLCYIKALSATLAPAVPQYQTQFRHYA